MTLADQIAQTERIDSVLDIGANDRRFKKYLPESCRYASLDRDESYAHDFRTLGDIPKDMQFGMTAMFAVVEHIPLDIWLNEFVSFFQRHLKPPGYLVISSRNIFHNIGIRTDYTHVQAYSPRNLHAMLRNFEFTKIGVYRIAGMSPAIRWIFDLLSRTLFKPYCLDYCRTICWVYRYAPAAA
jgi:hypothetical protein